MTALVQINNVNFSYGNVTVLEDVTLNIEKNKLLAIVGPNGGGKSTLLKLILRLLNPDSGSISYIDPVQTVADIGYVPQVSHSDRSFPISVIDAVLLGLTGTRPYVNRFNKSDREQATESLKKVSMQDYSQRQIGELSEGQRQRVFVARALVSNPKLILLDEPTASVDQRIQHSLYKLMAELKQSISLVMVTHDVGEITDYIDDIACLNQKLHHHINDTNKLDKDMSYYCAIGARIDKEKKGKCACC
ncbi:MAG: hypothetical protein A2Y40_04425 [Candidatus Margulisbacteria bacterium GWF2_35_9]|nr:MAG: hypothetical protein A2Y40_04425 [Candidatus Margulisbacteria bacterium GWF2_35_9]